MFDAGSSALERVVVINDRSSRIGGAEIMALLSAEQMASAGIPVTFIAGDDAEDFPLDRSKIEVLALGGSPPHEGRYARQSAVGFYNARARRLLQDFIAARDTPGTVYHLHNWSKILSPAVFLALRKVSARLFISAHDYAMVCPTLSYSNMKAGGPCRLTPLSPACLASACDRRSRLHKLWRVGRLIERRWFMDVSKTRASVGVIHPDMLEYFTRGGIPRERLRVVRNPTVAYSSQRVRAEANRDLFFIGRVVHEKGVDLAAEAARRAGWRLRVVGDGDMRQAIQSRYPEVVFEGWRNHAQIGELIREARAVILPSRMPETFTLVAHEAMRSGVPVVAFEDVDCREAAQLGAAIVVPPREVSSLVEGLRRLDDDVAVARMSQLAMKHAHLFSNTTATWRAAMLECYAELLGCASGAAASDARAS
jgi:glycosyltransferase involved in cell wall biosynthesis